MPSNYVYVVADPDESVNYTLADDGRLRFIGQYLYQYRQDGVRDQIWKMGNQHGLITPAVMIAERNPGAEDPPHEETWTSGVGATSRFFYVQKRESLDDLDVYRWWQVSPDGTSSVTVAEPGDPELFNIPDQRVQPSFKARYTDDSEAPFVSQWNLPVATEIVEQGEPSLEDLNFTGSTWAALITGDYSNEMTQPIPPDPYDITVHSQGQLSEDGLSLYFSFWGEPFDQFNSWDGATLRYHVPGGGASPIIVNFDVQQVEHIVIDIPNDVDYELPYNSTLNTIYHAAYYTPPFTTDDDGKISAPGQLVLVPSELNDKTLDFASYFRAMTANITGTSTIIPVAPYAYRVSEYRFNNGVLDESSTYFEQGDGMPGSEIMSSDLILQPGRGIYTAVVGQIQDADNYGGGQQFSVAVHFAPGEAITGNVGEQRTRFTG